MLLQFIRPLRLLARAFTAAATPRQLAFGFALGMMIGLVPKGNLTAGLLTVILLGTQANLGTGLTAAVLFSWVGVLADPLSHRVGHAFLTAEPLQPMWAYLYNLPLAPWTGFNNTVVLGSLLLGLWLFYPVYRLSEPVLESCQSRLADKLSGYRIVQLLIGKDTAADGRT